jgi:hypothetical protein
LAHHVVTEGVVVSVLESESHQVRSVVSVFAGDILFEDL